MAMLTVLTVLHVLIAVVLIVVVLMQSQQSMNLSGMFGGASQSALGNQPQSVLGRATTVLAIVFMVSSLVYALIPAGNESVLSPGAVRTGPPMEAGSPGENAASPAGRDAGAPAGPEQPSPEGTPEPAPSTP